MFHLTPEEKPGVGKEKFAMKRKNNFDRYLEEQLKDKDFADRFKKGWPGLGCRFENQEKI